MAARRAAVAARHLSRRLVSSSSPAAAPRLLGHFHNPVATDLPLLDRIPSDPVFHPLTASSPRLSLDFVPDAASGFSLFDPHQGLVLLIRGSELGPRFLVCDPAARRHAFLPPRAPHPRRKLRLRRRLPHHPRRPPAPGLRRSAYFAAPDDGKDYGHPMFAYFAAPDGVSD